MSWIASADEVTPDKPAIPASRPSYEELPIADRREWFYEHHRIFLNGRLRYDEETGKGVVGR